MKVELGNRSPKEKDESENVIPLEGNRVTYIDIPDVYSFSGTDDKLLPENIFLAVDSIKDEDIKNSTRRLLLEGWLTHSSGVRGLPDHEAFVSIVDPNGIWANHSSEDPTWVWSEDKTLEKMLSLHYGCPVGRPDDLEDTHFTKSGMPGVGPDLFAGINMLKTNAGNDIQSVIMGGGLLGETGTATATSATSLTTNSAVNHAANDLAGQTVIAWTTGVYGLITANTSAATNTVLTVDRWYTPSTPGGVAASTPSATTGYTILAGGLPAWFMGLTANNSAPAAGDTTLASEITTAGGGLIRKICVFAHTAAAASYTLTAVFTANGTDSLPVTVAKAAVGQSIVSTVRNLFQTLLNATATFSLSGDQLTLTSTISL